MGNVNSIQTPPSYSFFDSNKPYLVSGMLLTSLSVVAFVGGIVWGNYSHAGCWALLGSGGLGTLPGLILILKNYGKNEKIQASTPEKSQETKDIETSKSSKKIQLPLEECIKKGHYILAREALQRGERPKEKFPNGPQILWDLIVEDPSSTALENFCGDIGRIYDQTLKAEIIFHFYNEMFQLLRSYSLNINCEERVNQNPYVIALKRGSFSAAYALVTNGIVTEFSWGWAFDALTQLSDDPVVWSLAVDFFSHALQKFECSPGLIRNIWLQTLYNRCTSQREKVCHIFHLACVAALKNKKSFSFSKALKFIIQRGLDVNHPLIVNYFLELVLEGDEVGIDAFIRKGIDLNQSNSQGRLPLQEAARANRKSLVEKLLDHGANKQNRDRRGNLASEITSNQEIQTLIHNWTEANICLHRALTKTNLKLVQKALETKINCKRWRETILERALSKSNDFAMIQLLIEKRLVA